MITFSWAANVAAAGGYLLLDTLGSTYDTVLSIYDGAGTSFATEST